MQGRQIKYQFHTAIDLIDWRAQLACSCLTPLCIAPLCVIQTKSFLIRLHQFEPEANDNIGWNNSEWAGKRNLKIKTYAQSVMVAILYDASILISDYDSEKMSKDNVERTVKCMPINLNKQFSSNSACQSKY